MRLLTLSFVFLILSICCKHTNGQNATVPIKEPKPKAIALNDSLAKDFAKTEKFLKKLKKKLSFLANIRAKEKKRMDAIVKKYISDANLLSGVDIKRINDSLSKTYYLQLDSLGKLIASMNDDRDNLSKEVKGLKKNLDSLAGTIPDASEDIELDKLADKMVVMIKEKAKEEESKEKRDKKLQLIYAIANHPEGIRDTVIVNDTISSCFTLQLKKKEVFGFHPFWRNADQYQRYDFNVLSSLIYYGCELHPKTGLFKDNHDWAKQKVTDYAKSKNCRVYLGVYCEGISGIKALLTNYSTQESVAASLVEQVELKKADGLNLIFGTLEGNYRLKFIRFITILTSKLKAANPDYKLTLTIPVLDKGFLYDVRELEPFVEKFIIDFTKKNIRGPIVPITGNDYSLESGLARYFSSGVASEKFIACFPYRGAIWDAESNLEFIDYISYANIEESYTSAYGVVYANGSARCDVVFNKTDTLEQLWFDDAKTLSEKYSYILERNLSGVGVWALGDDGYKPELWETLLDKMIQIDTVDVTTLKTEPIVAAELSFWQKIKRELNLYYELFEHPCDFEKVNPDLGYSERELMVSDDYIIYLTLFMLLCLLVTGLYAVFNIRAYGDDWPKRKLFLSILIVLTVLNMITMLMFVFLSKDFKGFGAYSDSCEVSLISLLLLIGIGFIMGGLAMRLLIIPLIKRKEIP